VYERYSFQIRSSVNFLHKRSPFSTTSDAGSQDERQSLTFNIPMTIPLICEIRPRHHTPSLLGTGVPSVL
jgi:hypothetical protein